MSARISDGTSNTIFFAEGYYQCVPSFEPGVRFNNVNYVANDWGTPDGSDFGSVWGTTVKWSDYQMGPEFARDTGQDEETRAGLSAYGPTRSTIHGAPTISRICRTA